MNIVKRATVHKTLTFNSTSLSFRESDVETVSYFLKLPNGQGDYVEAVLNAKQAADLLGRLKYALESAL